MARPIQFDRSEVLENAMHAFWINGYNATSMTDLAEVTRLNPGSIYAAFGSKEGLFLDVLDYYGDRSVSRVSQVLANAKSPLLGIRQYFTQLGKDSAGKTASRSCLLVNTVLELSRRQDNIRQRVNHQLEKIELLFRGALEAAQASGELAADKDAKALATLLMTNIWGLRVLGGTRLGAAKAKAVVTQLMALLD